MKRVWHRLFHTTTFVRATLLGMLAGGIGLAACSGDDTQGAVQPGPRPEGGTSEASHCVEGATQDCTITVGEHNGVLTCYEGKQVCVGGQWGECADGQVTSKVWNGPAWVPPSNTGMKPFAGPATACVNNPCDPTCQQFNEDPDAGLTAEVVPTVFPWVQGGAFGQGRNGLIKKGLKKPCYSTFDCQFDHYCDDVATGSSCAHSKCSKGAPLALGCDKDQQHHKDDALCVDMICAVDPTCCTLPTAHDPCVTGDALDSRSHTCIDTLCGANNSTYNYCCKTTWDAACVDRMLTVCPGICSCKSAEILGPNATSCYYYDSSNRSWSSARNNCTSRGTGWDLINVNDAAENSFANALRHSWVWLGANDRTTEGSWRAADGTALPFTRWYPGQPDNGPVVGWGDADCAELNDWEGRWDDEDCDYPQHSICEGPAAAGGNVRKWGQQCVDMVATVCGAKCSDDIPPSSAGVCTPFLPGDTDPTCTGIDLTAGIPCDGTIPICNRGKTKVTDRIRIVHYPSNSQQYPSYPACNPGQSHPQMTTCYTDLDIEPGQCINVTGCMAANDNNREIMVNPSGWATGVIPECNCRNNWTLFAKENPNSSITCEPPDCSGAVSRADIKPVNIYFTVDRSGSMFGDKWNGARAAMEAFFASADSASLKVALEFLPLADAANGGLVDGCGPNSWTCGSAICANPAVPMNPLTTAARPTDTQEAALFKALVDVGSPAGRSPIYPALDGALSWSLTNWTETQRYVVVLVTDSQPNDCCPTTGSCTAALAGLAEKAFTTKGIRTYTIGMDGANPDALNLIALSGGTEKARMIVGTDYASVASQLSATLLAIAGQSASCELALRDPSTFNINDASVYYNGAATPLPHLDGASQCGTGWYFNATHTAIELCKATCDIVKADPTATIDVHLGCPASYEASTTTEVYEASCPPGAGPQWGYLTYKSSTPGDSNIVFRVRTASTEAQLATKNFVYATTASMANANEVCSATLGPDTLCPVDLSAILPAPASWMPFLEVERTLNPSQNKSITPILESWEVTYSCRASE